MDRKTKQMLEDLKEIRNYPWKPGTQVMGQDVYKTIHIVEGLSRILRPGRVILQKERDQRKQSRLQVRRETREYRESLDRFVSAVEEMNDELSNPADAILISLGYRRHNRDDWQLKCDSTTFDRFRDEVLAMKATRTQPLIQHSAPENEPEARKLFEKARKGNAEALKSVQSLIRDKKWVGWLGDLGHDATLQLLALVAAGDPVWKAGLIERVGELSTELLGDNPSVLERLLVQRVLNGWIAVHSLELEFAARPPELLERREYLDKAITRAQKRYTEAIHELARVRRLQAPKLLARAVRTDDPPQRHDMIPMNAPIETIIERSVD